MKNEKIIPTDNTAEIPVPDTGASAVGTAPPLKYADRLSKAYPDKEYKTQDEHDAGLDTYMNDLEGYKERGKAANKKLIALFEAEPAVGDVVRDMMNGATFREALAKHISPDDITAIEGDPDYEGWNKNKNDREANLEKRKADQDNYAKNITISEQAVTSFVEKKGLSPEQADEFFEKFDSMLSDIDTGLITEEHLESIMKAFSYDTDMSDANEQGKIAGRNENIIAKKATPGMNGDGLPRPTRSAQEQAAPNVAPNYMDNLVNKTRSKDVFA